MEAFMAGPVQVVLALIAAMAAGAVGGFFLRDWIDHRQRRRQARAREALLGRRPARPGPHPPAPARLERDPSRVPAEPPRVTWSAPTIRGDMAVPGGAATGATVLIVDDRYELRAVNAACLAGNGYRVIEAADGDAALEAVRRERPDAILLDHSMPNRTGLEVVGELKADPATAGIPIIFMTAHSYGAVGRKAMAAGCASYLPKPCDPGRVLQEVARHTRSA